MSTTIEYMNVANYTYKYTTTYSLTETKNELHVSVVIQFSYKWVSEWVRERHSSWRQKQNVLIERLTHTHTYIMQWQACERHYLSIMYWLNGIPKHVINKHLGYFSWVCCFYDFCSFLSSSCFFFATPSLLLVWDVFQSMFIT